MLKKLMFMAMFIIAPAAVAQPSQPNSAPTFQQRVAAARLPISIEGGKLRDTGAELLASEIRASHFLMVGEQHATATIAEIIAALHQQAASSGYNHAAIEMGPHSARHVEQLIRSGQGRLAQFVRRPGNGLALPFLFWEEEVELAEQIVAVSPRRQNVLWGLDQEFVGSAPVVVGRLAALSKTPEQKRVVAQFRERATAEPMLIGSMLPTDYEPLQRAFPAAGNREAARLIEDLVLSSRVYGAFSRGAGTIHMANATREEYMKLNFLRAFEAAERAQGTPPRVFLRFGGNHAFRGFSMSNVPALGNFIAEWGLSRGLRMTNIFIGCAGGQQNNPQTGANGPCNADELSAESPLRTQMSDAPLSLFDLRPLRAYLNNRVDPATRQMILAFDFYLSARDVRPATPLVIGRQ